MTEYWLSLNSHLAIILFIGVLLAERAFPIPVHLHPIWALQQMARHITRRVHPSITRPRSQQRISGLMTTLIFILLWVAVPALLYWLAELKLWFGAAILWLSLFSQPWLREAKVIQQSLQNGQKQLAQTRLQRWLNRDCGSLTIFGIEKAASEQCVMRQLQGWFGVLFWYAMLGPIAALFYRVCFELNRAWPAELFYWRDFGAISQALFKLINWPPHIIILAVLLTGNFFKDIKHSFKYKRSQMGMPHFNQPKEQLFYALTRIFPLELGGPVKYMQRKITRLRYKHPSAIQANRIKSTIKYLSFIQIFLFIIALLPLLGQNI